MAKLDDLTGRVFGRLTALEFLGRKNHSSLWRCRCECGNTTESTRASLISGTAKSCGCYRSERMSRLQYKHGERGGEKRTSRPPEYRAWDSIKQRCTNPRNKDWDSYGGRGIKIADEWATDFAAFFAHIGPRPSDRHSVDRIDGTGDYAPGNVRWTDWHEQANNRKNNRLVCWDGRDMTLKQASVAASIPYKTVKGRVQKGWDVLRALTTPLDVNKVNAQRNHRKAERTS